jgi:hypothetical protein
MDCLPRADAVRPAIYVDTNWRHDHASTARPYPDNAGCGACRDRRTAVLERGVRAGGGRHTGRRPAASPAASPVAGSVACDEDAPRGRLVAVPNRVTIELTDSGFDPAIIQSTDNTTFDLTLVNTGTEPHSFVMEDFELRVELAPGESESIVLTPVDRGGADDHYFHGDLPGEECFQGKLVLYI